MGKVANHLKSYWESCLLEHRHLNDSQRRELIHWLLGDNMEKLENLTTEELAIATHGITKRYRLLLTQYLGVAPKQAYRHLFNRFGTALTKSSLLRSWITASKNNQKVVLKTLEEMIVQLMKVDPHLRVQKEQISQCVKDSSLSNALLLTAIEEYCLHSINHHPLLFHLLCNFLRRQPHGQMTPQQHKLLQLLSRETQQTSFNTQSITDFQRFSLQVALKQTAQLVG